MITKNQIKFIKSLSYSKYRNRYKKFIVEGARICGELIEAKHKVDFFYVTEFFLNKNLNFFKEGSNYSYEIISEKDFDQIRNTKKSQGIIAVVPFIDSSINQNPIEGNILILDNISDPGNMGTLMRSAVWFGVKNIFFTNGCVDRYNPKVVRSGMGAHFYLSNLEDLDISDLIKKIKDNKHILLSATMDGTPYEQIKEEKEWALVLGSEAHGVNESFLSESDRSISIPRIGSIESLNVAVAGSILLDRLNHE